MRKLAKGSIIGYQKQLEGVNCQLFLLVSSLFPYFLARSIWSVDSVEGVAESDVKIAEKMN